MKVSTKESKVKACPSKVNCRSAKAKKFAGKESKQSAQDQVLEILAESLSLGQEVVERSKLPKMTGLSPKTIANALTKLKKEELIEMDSKTIRLVEKGKEKVKALIIIPKTNLDRHSMLKQKLKGKELVVFDMMAQGFEMDKTSLAKALGYDDKSTKAFQNLMSSMKGKGILEYPTKETVRLTDFCFPRGRKE